MQLNSKAVAFVNATLAGMIVLCYEKLVGGTAKKASKLGI